MRRKLFAILLLVLLLCVACDAKPVIPTVLPLRPSASPLIPSSATATLASSQTPLLTITPTALPMVTLTPAGIAPFPGLMYKVGKELWQIDSGGRAVQLSEHTFDYLSLDGTSVIDLRGSRFSNEMWLIDLITGQQRNLTEELGRSLCCIARWPERPNTILFGSWPLQNVGRNSGYLSVIQADGSGFKILDDVNTFAGEPAPSPDGVTIAYSAGSTGMIYQWGSVPQSFEPESFGLSVDYLKSPSWSPDGKKMTWTAVKNDQYSVAIFDLSKRTAELAHSYPLTVEWPPAPIWSPDGRWLAIVVNNADSIKQELWVVPVNAPQDEHLLRGDPVVAYPVWSPDSRWLVSKNMLYEVGTWHAQPLALPPDAEVVAWINPAQQ
jgi:hypothetical protein